ncbi:hypothetical protein BGW38_001051 [Lunasporangiospora selenospora]|uniref:SWIB/MDM2 domain-containing protein n=1 Tax=Lunasporangiospora selenospora TaxID=979761 RepID=A0A9P6FUL6_9FUNG|nr:hypothetical protein BGW38_001051 [Lunasporangiospora selenospora]
MASVEIYRAKVEELMAKADISTVSAKRIRREIEALTNTNLSDVKREFDDMVLEIYDRFAENPAPKVASKPAPKPASKPASKPDQTSASAVKAKAVTTKPTKRTNSKDSADSESDDSDSNSESEEISDDGAPPTKKAKKSSSTTAASSKKTKEKKTKPKAKAKAKTTKKSTKSDKESKPRDTSNNPFFQPLILSDPLSELIGHKGTVGTSGKVEMPRCTVVKYLWEHIKENDLKDKTGMDTLVFFQNALL